MPKFKIGDMTQEVGCDTWKRLITDIKNGQYITTVNTGSSWQLEGQAMNFNFIDERYELDRKYMWNKEIKEITND